MPVASGPRLDTPQQPWRYPVNSVQEFFEPLPPRRPPPGPLAWLRSLAPAPTRSATPVTRLFDGHAAARMVLLTGLRGSGHHLLLRARLAQDLSERTGHQTLPITTVARGLSLREVRCGPYLPVEERCQERQQQQQQQQPWWGLTAWFTPSAGQKKRRQHCFRQLDIGCPPKTHALVRRMFSFADAVVWVMDATDRDTPRQSLDRLAHIILDSTGLPPDKPLLILLNWNGMERNEVSCCNRSNPV